MIAREFTSVRAYFGCALLLAASGCMVPDSEPGRRVSVGRMEVPLLAASGEGTSFNLTGTFDLVGPESLSQTVSLSSASVNDSVLTFGPRVGNYTLSLSNWAIYEQVPGAAPVQRTDASLLNGAAQMVSILNNQTTTVTYQFVVPGSGPINFTRGSLQVDFTIDEGFPDGASCMVAQDCASLVCNASACAAPTCSDGVENGAEAGPDCGSACMNLCAGECFADTDCPAAETCNSADPTQGTSGTCSAGGTSGGGTSGGTTACTSDGDCVAGDVCDASSNQCVPGGTSGGGTSGGTTACTSDSDCVAGDVCDASSNQCVAGGTSGGGTMATSCFAATDCTPPLICVGADAPSSIPGTCQ